MTHVTEPVHTVQLFVFGVHIDSNTPAIAAFRRCVQITLGLGGARMGVLALAKLRAVESVWDYPRPPRLETSQDTIRVVHQGILLAETQRALRMLETSHPPVFYLPPEDVRMDLLTRSASRRSVCEFKGIASYWSLDLGKEIGPEADGAIVPDIAWSYPDPLPEYAAIKGHLAFYASRVDMCMVGDERVSPQAGDFYGGWITSLVTGPFKGPPGTRGW